MLKAAIRTGKPTTVDAALSFEPATVEVIRGETDEGGDLLAAHLAELRQQCDEGEGQRGADPSIEVRSS